LLKGCLSCARQSSRHGARQSGSTDVKKARRFRTEPYQQTDAD
jgi:hypothetical protein